MLLAVGNGREGQLLLRRSALSPFLVLVAVTAVLSDQVQMAVSDDGYI